MSKTRKQSAWKPGMEFNDDAHYQNVMADFSKELIGENTLVELAIIAASNVTYVDALERLIDELKSKNDLHKEISLHKETRIETLDELYSKANEELKSSVPIDESIRIVQFAIKRFQKEKWGKGGHARARKHYDKDQALADWKDRGHTFSSARAFARESYRTYGATDYLTVYRWILAERKSES